MDESDLIIKAASLLAKDLIVDGSNIRKTLLKLQSNQQAAATNELDKNSIDEDIELLLMRKFLPKKRYLNTSNIDKNLNKKRKPIKNHHTVVSSVARKIAPPAPIKLEPQIDKTINLLQALPTKPKITINNQYFNYLEQCNDTLFENQFKFTKKTFQALKAALCPLLDLVLQHKPFNDIVLTKTQLILCSLWIMTTTEPIQKIIKRFGIPKDQLVLGFRCVYHTISSNKYHFIKWPNEGDMIKAMEQFNEETNAVNSSTDSNDDDIPSFSNVCGIIGSTDIQIPLTDDCVNGDSSDEKYSNVKLQLICNANGLLMDCYVEQIETGSNVMVFNKSAIKRLLDRNPNNGLPIEGHLIGDQTYPLKTYLMVPFKEHRKSDEMQRYNAGLMKKRKIIDCTIMQLKERFSRLKFINMQISMELSQCIEMACVLHNFCIENVDTYCLQIDADIPLSRAICRDFTIDQRAIDKRNRILDSFKRK